MCRDLSDQQKKFLGMQVVQYAALSDSDLAPLHELLVKLWQREPPIGVYPMLKEEARTPGGNASVAPVHYFMQRMVQQKSIDVRGRHEKVWRGLRLEYWPQIGDVLVQSCMATTWDKEVALRHLAKSEQGGCRVVLEIDVRELGGMPIP